MLNKILYYFYKNKIRLLIVTIFAFLTLLTSWNSDDAYHAYIMAKNLAEGHGFVYNSFGGLRVTATTCPLFTLLTALLYFLMGCRHMYFAGIFLGVFFSAAAIYVLVFYACNTIKEASLSVLILSGSFSFMCYTTAGLENSLLFFLSSLFLVVYLKDKSFSGRNLFWLAFILSLLAMTRMDSVLIFVPAICIGYLFFTRISFIRRIFIGFLGLLPFMLWEIFSIIYYGYPFPNTMYMKLNTGFPKIDYIQRGILYIFSLSTTDIILLAAPILFIILSIMLKNKKLIAVAAGCFAYIIYVIYVGGDFMMGRFLTVPLFISIFGLICLYRGTDYICKKDNVATPPPEKAYKPLLCKILSAFVILEIICASCINPIGEKTLHGARGILANSPVANEKSYYYNFTGLIPYILGHANGRDLIYERFEEQNKNLKSLKASGAQGSVEDYLSGMVNYYVQHDDPMYLTDTYGLMDPLLSHLPAIYEKNWWTGHMKREIPAGYSESVQSGTNMIVNSSLHEYYDKVLLITRGKLFDKERLKTIVDMNLGRYDYLIDEYLDSKATACLE